MSDCLESLFDTDFCVDKPIRLIELFGGIGSQAMALRDLGADFEHYRLVEFDKYAVASYNAIHGTSFEPTDIRNVHGGDLGIVDKDRFCYLLTYSFPCQSLSVAGKMEGMSKADWESGKPTRSGLLWEVERILKELPKECLPDILLMENVPQVHAEKNLSDFESWQSFLRGRGYQNFCADLNARDFGIPQNRNRCFMVSILSDECVDFEFPEKIELETVMKDYLEEFVDEKYYINSEKADKLIKQLVDSGVLDSKKNSENREQRELHTIDLCVKRPREITVANAILARYDAGIRNIQSAISGVVSDEGLSPTLSAGTHGYANPHVFTRYRIRKLTPKECWRLMGYTDEDFDKASAVNSNTQLYKEAGNAIVKQVLMAIFRQLKLKTKGAINVQ